MAIRDGYKQTEIGVIPSDWDVVKLGEISKIQRGASPRPIDNPIWFDNRASVGWVRISDVTCSGTYLNKTVQHLSPLGIQYSRPVSAGSLIMSICATVGRPIITTINVCIHDGFVVFSNIQSHQLFLYHYLKRIEPEWSKQGQTGSQMNLNTEIISTTTIPVPPLPEQERIATALSDVDALIASLDAVIDKKKDIKQAAMQELLTGKTRLDGFSGKWVEKNVDDLTSPSSSKYISSVNRKNVFCIELEHINKNDGTRNGFTSELQAFSAKTTFQKGDVLFGRLRAYLQKYWFADRAGICSTEIWVLRPKLNFITSAYLFYIIQTKPFIKAASFTYGTHMPRSDWGVMRQLKILLPPTIAEQEAIATVLSDMDTEITALQKRRDKVCLLKTSMMQELLTGNTRLNYKD